MMKIKNQQGKLNKRYRARFRVNFYHKKVLTSIFLTLKDNSRNGTSKINSLKKKKERKLLKIEYNIVPYKSPFSTMM